MNLVELQNKIHQQSVELGWWDEERPRYVFADLFHSELSEAMEGDRKGLMDDHLPEHEMFWVELADFAIRGLDYLGNKMYAWRAGTFVTPNKDKLEDLAYLHCLVTEWYQSKNLDLLSAAIMMCFAMGDLHGVDLMKIINEKVEYNKHRSDHKRENRAKAGGKKY